MVTVTVLVPQTPQISHPRKPHLGETVIYYQGDYDCIFDRPNARWTGTNGTRFHPAIITRVWSDTCVNLIVLVDATGPIVICSVSQLPAEDVDVHWVNSGWRYM